MMRRIGSCGNARTGRCGFEAAVETWPVVRGVRSAVSAERTSWSVNTLQEQTIAKPGGSRARLVRYATIDTWRPLGPGKNQNADFCRYSNLRAALPRVVLDFGGGGNPDRRLFAAVTHAALVRASTDLVDHSSTSTLSSPSPITRITGSRSRTTARSGTAMAVKAGFRVLDGATLSRRSPAACRRL